VTSIKPFFLLFTTETLYFLPTIATQKDIEEHVFQPIEKHENISLKVCFPSLQTTKKCYSLHQKLQSAL